MITNTQAVKFSNEQIRILGDLLLSAIRTAQHVREYYYAHPELGTIFTDGIAEQIDDGSTVDGRPIMTGNDVLAIVTRADELNTSYTANNNALLNTLLRVAVRGEARL